MISKIVIAFTFLLAFFSVNTIFGQEKKFDGDPDKAFETARNLAFNQHRKQAQDSLVFILGSYPDYHDIREFLATTYSWDEDYKKAEKEFTYILNKDSKRKTTWIAAIKNELWANMPFIALEKSNEALKIFPNDPDILYLKASAYEKTKNPLEAMSTIELVLNQNPDNQEAKDFKINLNKSLSQNTIGINSSVDFYSSTFNPMQYYTFRYGRQTKYGSIIAKVNLNRRFDENGAQYEVDLYPKITKGLYAYVNFGLANSFLFPDMRYGAELYKSLPKSFEVSLGFRTLKYATSTTNIFTGSVGWYNGNNYWSFRPYLTPGDTGTSKSGNLIFRRYRSDADNYLELSAGMGYSPENNQNNISGNLAPIVDLKSQKINTGYYFSSPNKRNNWGTQFGVTHQEKTFDQGNYFWIYTLALSWEVKFK
jgi:YaiO family outer membrane protein